MDISPGAVDYRSLPIELRRDLLRSGHTDRSIARAVAAGSLGRVRHGAYVDGAAWAQAGALDRSVLRSRAAQIQAGTGVALSHSSAMPFLDAPTWGLDLEDVHLTRLDGKAGRREAGVRQHCGVLLDGDLAEDADPLITSATRAILETTTVADVEPSLVVANDLLNRGMTTLEALAKRYEQSMTQWPGSLRTEHVLRLANPKVESVGETRLGYFWWRAGLPRLVPQVEVHLPDGTIARLDFLIEGHDAWLEFDGMQKYVKHLRPGETVAQAVVREKAREDLVREVTGRQCMRVVWRDLETPRHLEARARAFIARVLAGRRRPA